MSRRKRKAGARKIVVVTSDWHCGHSLGLMAPDTKLFEDTTDLKKTLPINRDLGTFQSYLWGGVWLRAIRSIERLADGDPVILIVNGDITHGKKYPDQLVTTSTANQFLIAAGALGPWAKLVKNLKAIRFAFGTQSHEFQEGTSVAMVSELVRPKFPGVDIGCVHHGLVDVDGVLIDYAHHGPSQGIREWTKGNQLRYYLKSLVSGCIKNGQPPPDAVYRSHYHYPHREIISEFRMSVNGRPRTMENRIYLTPSMCGMNDYSYQATRSTNIIFNGMMALEIEDRKIRDDHLDDFVWMLDMRAKEQL